MIRTTILQIALIFFMASSALSGANPNISLGSGSGVVGSTVQVPVTLTNATGIAVSAIGIDVGYDTNCLENPVASIGPAADRVGKQISSNLSSAGLFRIGVAGLNNNAIGDGIVANVTFSIKSTAPVGSTTLLNTPSASDSNGDLVPVSGSNGSITVAAGGGPPKISVSPGSVNFGKVRVGVVSRSKTVTIKNTGLSVLVIGSITLAGANASEFSQSNNCSSVLSKGSVCVVRVTFTPRSADKKTATLSIASNVPDDSVLTVKLSGVGK